MISLQNTGTYIKKINGQAPIKACLRSLKLHVHLQSVTASTLTDFCEGGRLCFP